MHVVSIGMVTAVGLDAPSSCAAMRARLDGFAETRFMGARGGAMVGAPVAMPRPWIGERQLAHMAAAAMIEAFDAVPQARDQAVLVLCLPEPGRPGTPVRDPAGLLRRIDAILGLNGLNRSRVVAHGRPGGLVAIEQARRLLADRRAPFVIIAGVDSYLRSETLRHYANHRRILGPENPDGFIPGEAAAAVLLAPAGPGLRLIGTGLAREPAPIYNEADLPLRGDGMTSAYRAALDASGIGMNRLGYRISDLIGEKYWFKQSALASLRLVRGEAGFQDLWSPSESLGNIGAAVIPTMIGMAFTAARKGYAGGSPVLIEASDDTGACGAAVFREAA
jgi:3-oxoacyl-[acyl-carrier-protein] synthase I